jgi:hypothetical protein
VRLSVRWTARGPAGADLQRLRADTVAGPAGALCERTEQPSGQHQIFCNLELPAAPHELTATPA